MVYSGLDNDEHKFLEAWENSKKKEMSERTKMEIEELQKFKVSEYNILISNFRFWLSPYEYEVMTWEKNEKKI